MAPISGSAPGDSPVPGSRRSTTWFVTALFVFVSLFLLLRFRVDTRLLYLKGPGLFVLDLDFFRQFLDYPGRPVRYLTFFLDEITWFPVLGAIVLAGLLTLAGLGTRALFARSLPEGGGPSPPSWRSSRSPGIVPSTSWGSWPRSSSRSLTRSPSPDYRSAGSSSTRACSS
jgi:hypothetical protein